LTERLDQHRGGGKQQITVKHVTVNADQAVVADQIVSGRDKEAVATNLLTTTGSYYYAFSLYLLIVSSMFPCCFINGSGTGEINRCALIARTFCYVASQRRINPRFLSSITDRKGVD
jgi:hypothetical protein